MSFQDLFEQFKSLAKKHLGDPETIEQNEEQAADGFSAPGKEKVKEVINDFLAISPLIEQAGYRITDLQVELGLIPKLIPHFTKVADVDEQQKQMVIDQLQQKRLMKLLVSALFKADSFQQGLSMKNYTFKGIEIEIAALPAVRLNYHHLLAPQPESKEISPQA